MADIHKKQKATRIMLTLEFSNSSEGKTTDTHSITVETFNISGTSSIEFQLETRGEYQSIQRKNNKWYIPNVGYFEDLRTTHEVDLLDDNTAEKRGLEVAKELQLEQNEDGRYDLVSGTKTPIGLLKTIQRILNGKWNQS